MSDTTIVLNVTDSGLNPLPSLLRVTLDADLHDADATPARLLTTVPREFDLPSGTLTFALPSSDRAQTTYYFELIQRAIVRSYFLPNGTEYAGTPIEDDGQFYTGDPNDGGELLTYTDRDDDTIVMAFRSIVPESVTPLAFGDLIPTGITREVLDANLARLAQILARDPDLETQIVQIVGDAANVNFSPTAPLESTNVAGAIAELLALAVLRSQNFSDLSDAAAARSNLGLGTAATQPATAFAPASHGHNVSEIAFAAETAGGTPVKLTNAPNAIAPFATPDEWVRIQLAGNTYVFPAWLLP